MCLVKVSTYRRIRACGYLRYCLAIATESPVFWADQMRLVVQPLVELNPMHGSSEAAGVGGVVVTH
jgi:hypothetical protein